MIIDAHCHLYYDSLANDIDNVIQRANEAGVSRIGASASVGIIEEYNAKVAADAKDAI